MNLSKRIIKGHTELHLIPENKYYISYGVNQGIYIYKGQFEKSDNEFWDGASLFVNEKTGKEFCYFGTNSPYEFTSIIKSI
jgi:hypothetical protein